MRAIGLAGQMHGATLLDGDGEVLRPCILWDDGRSAPQCAQLEAAAPGLRAITGNVAMPGFTAPKLLWVREHEPDVFARIRRVLLPKAWLRWRLCGEAIEEMSDASGTLVARRRARGAGPADAAGRLRARRDADAAPGRRHDAGRRAAAPSGCARWGFERAPIIAGGAGDNAAGAVGAGRGPRGRRLPLARDLGRAVGDHGAASRRRRERGVHAFCHAVPQTWHQMGVLLARRGVARLVGARARAATRPRCSPSSTRAGARAGAVLVRCPT